MKLILIRHGLAGEYDPQRYPDDRLRPLTDDGRTLHRAVAEAMKRAGLAFDRLITSPLVRARQTAEITAEVYGLGKPEQSDALGDGYSVRAVIELTRRFSADETVALVGHEPDLSSLTSTLLGGGSVDFPKSGVLGLDFDRHPAPGEATLLFFLRPEHFSKREGRISD